MLSDLLNLLSQPWPWYVSGVAITLVMAFLLFWGKEFGFSSNLRNICSALGAGKVSNFFKFDWKAQKWNLLFLTGSMIGGIISSTLLKNKTAVAISRSTIDDLQKLGIQFDRELVPLQLFGTDAILSLKNLLLYIAGGFLIGFGSRYAGGCTSGHAISGLSNFQLPSLIAVIGFFIGGLLTTYLILPLIF